MHESASPTNGEWQRLATCFPTAPPELVFERALRYRADSKFVLSASNAAALLLRLTGDYAAVAAGAGFVASYRTLYFDTAQLDFFHAHRRGRRVRHKARVRHYADRALTLLEVKTRQSDLYASKIWRDREYGDDALRADDQEFIRAHTGTSANVLPQVWTDFRRLTFVGLQTNERITIDVDLAFDAGPGAIPLAGVAIVEVKQWPHSRATPVMTVLRRSGCRPSGISKYCVAIAMTRPHVRRNRLLPDLRALARVMEAA